MAKMAFWEGCTFPRCLNMPSFHDNVCSGLERCTPDTLAIKATLQEKGEGLTRKPRSLSHLCESEQESITASTYPWRWCVQSGLCSEWI